MWISEPTVSFSGPTTEQDGDVLHTMYRFGAVVGASDSNLIPTTAGKGPPAGTIFSNRFPFLYAGRRDHHRFLVQNTSK